jgi:hypothetical protein
MRIFGFILILHLTAPALWGQSLYLVPHYNLNFPSSRLADNSQGYQTFKSHSFGHFNGHFGIFAEYQSEGQWRIGSGITTGAVGLGYQLSIDYPGAFVSRFEHRHSTNHYFMRVPVLFMYAWKDIRLFRLHNYRKPGRMRQPIAKDENIFYALLFKVQPIFGLSINYSGKLNRYDGQGSGSENIIQFDNARIDRPVKQLRTTNLSAIIGFRLQFYSFGKDRLALTALYHQGLQDVIEINARYTIDGNGPYYSTIRSRGSGLSLTLSYPIRVFTFDKEERQLRKQNR